MNTTEKIIIFHADAGGTMRTYKCPAVERDGVWTAIFARETLGPKGSGLLFPLLPPIETVVPKCLENENAELYSPATENRFGPELLAQLHLLPPNANISVELPLSLAKMQELSKGFVP